MTAEEVVPTLTADNERLQKKVAALTAQLDHADKERDEERAARKQLEESRDHKIQDVEASWSAVLREKQDNWAAKEKSLEDKVESQDRLLQELKASYEVAQRLGRADDADADADGRRGATAAELDMVSTELERTSHRLADIEARNEQLRLQLAQSASAPAQHVVVEDEPAFLRLRSENASLLRKLDNARYDKDAERTRLETETRSLERELQSLKAEREALRDKVHKWGDYENVKQELEVLKVASISPPNPLLHFLTKKSPLSSQPERTMTKPPRPFSRQAASPAKTKETRSNSSSSHATRSSATS